ncbi:ELWxxDGT repeat protein [Myxococcus stipitatus]|uniref:ELWxxDGT repeat protein n=1 Tax=Myxococcus stipitatus TaxID=83455 RepID=UPI0030D0ECFF
MKDLFPGDLPYDVYSFSPKGFVSLGGFTFYTADDGTGDVELWKTDGTTAGTSLVRDLLPGPASSQPSNLTEMGGRLYFSARTAPGNTNSALWSTDGTTEGTTVVASMTHPPAFMTVHGGALYFVKSAPSSQSGFELWRSDGTAAGTTRLTTGVTGGAASNTHAWVGDTLFFVITDPALGRTLWKSDLTAAGTVMVKDVMPANKPSFDGPFALFSSGTLLYFKTQGIEDYRYVLWRSDGTEEGTYRLLSLQASSGSSFAPDLVSLEGRVFFPQWDAQAGNELWVSDGTVAGTQRLLDLRPGPGGAEPTHLVVGGTRLWFTAAVEDGNSQVFVSDGTAPGTRQVTGLPTQGLSNAWVAAVAPDGVFVWPSFPGSARELWKTDGTLSGLQKVVTLESRFSSGVYVHPIAGNRLFLSMPAGFLWFSDGTAAGSRALGRVIPDKASGAPRQGFNVGGSLVFSATARDLFSTINESYWTSNGSGEGTHPNIGGGSTQGASIRPVGTAGGQSFLWSQRPGSGSGTEHTAALLVTDGERWWDRPFVFRELPATRYPLGQTPPAAVLGQTLYFGSNGAESDGPSALWKTDGSRKGTVSVAAVQDGIFNVNPRLFVTAGEHLFFAAGIGLGDESLWTSDGTAPGTRPVKAFSSDNLAMPPIRHMVAWGSQVLFWAETEAEGFALWTSDGTGPGTRVLTRFSGSPSVFGDPLSTVLMGGQVYFVTWTQDGPARLWRTSGGPAEQVALLEAPSRALAPTRLTAFQGALWFWAYDAGHGYEPWTSDGTAMGTRRVKDIHPGPASATGTPGPMVGLGPDGPLVFAASDGLSGLELWMTDGTEAGTARFADLAPGPDSSSPTEFAVAGRRLFFQARTRETGAELWAMERTVQDTSPPTVTCPPSVAEEAIRQYSQPVTFASATAVDASGAPPIIRYSRRSGDSFSLGTTAVTVTALDEAGNRSTCTFDVTVRDTQPPTITCARTPLRIEATHVEGAPVYIPYSMATAADVASAVSMEYSIAQGRMLALGTTPVTATARDSWGNTASCTFEVIVQDTIAPTLSACPAFLSLEATGPEGAALAFDLPKATDAASRPEMDVTPAMGSLIPMGTSEVRVTARDTAKNQVQCVVPISVKDTTAPRFTCPDTQRLVAEPVDGKAAATWPEVIATDRVSVPSLNYSLAQGTRLPEGTHPVSITATDAAKNSSSCSFSIVVTKAPTSPEPETPTPQPERGGCQAGGSSASGLGAVLLGWWLARSRRRGAAPAR